VHDRLPSSSNTPVSDEILELNSRVIDDPSRLIPGQVIELPADANLGAGRGDR
jgi:hypothetical protein